MKKCCAFFTGVALGAVAAMLLTPKTGKEMQDSLIKKTNELQKKLKDFELSDTKEVLQEKVKETRELIQKFDWNESKEKVQKTFDEVTARLSEIKLQLQLTEGE